MPGRKRQSVGDDSDAGSDFQPEGSPPPKRTTANKRQRVSTGATSRSIHLPSEIPRRIKETLEVTPQEVLVAQYLELQEAYFQLKERPAPTAPNATPTWSPERVAETAERTTDTFVREIKKQMKWQPSCKRGTTKWSYTGVVPHEDVFYHMFGFPKPTGKGKDKVWKRKEISLADFGDRFGYITASIRYGSLSLTGQTVKLAWDRDLMTFTLSGTYGL